MGKYTLRICFAAFAVVVGVAAGLAFALVFGNLKASILASANAFFAAIALFEHSYRQKCEAQGRLPSRHSVQLRISGAIAAVGGFGGFLVLFIPALFAGDKLNPKSRYVACVWCVLTLKWGILHLYYADKYAEEDKELLFKRPLMLKSTNSIQNTAEDEEMLIA